MATDVAAGTETKSERGPTREARPRGDVFLRRLSTLAMAGATAMFAAGVWAWRVEADRPPVGASLAFPTKMEAGILAAGEHRPVTFRVVNRDKSRAAKLVGAEYICTPDGCVTPKGLPLTVPAGGSADFVVDYEARKVGRNALEFQVFTDAPGQMQVPLTIVGEMKPAAAAH